MPVAAQEPVTFLAGIALARPVDEPLLHQVIVPAHGCCWNNSVVVGCPSHDQRIELCDDPRLWSGLQLLQALINGSQVALARFLAWSDDGFALQRLLLRSKPGVSCHPERSEGSVAMSREMLRCAQHDSAVLYWLLANIETQENKAYLSLIGCQRMREACFVSMEM